MTTPKDNKELKALFEEAMQDGWNSGDYDDMLDAAAKLAEELLAATRTKVLDEATKQIDSNRLRPGSELANTYNRGLDDALAALAVVRGEDG